MLIIQLSIDTVPLDSNKFVSRIKLTLYPWILPFKTLYSPILENFLQTQPQMCLLIGKEKNVDRKITDLLQFANLRRDKRYNPRPLRDALKLFQFVNVQGQIITARHFHTCLPRQ